MERVEGTFHLGDRRLTDSEVEYAGEVDEEFVPGAASVFDPGGKSAFEVNDDINFSTTAAVHDLDDGTIEPDSTYATELVDNYLSWRDNLDTRQREHVDARISQRRTGPTAQIGVGLTSTALSVGAGPIPATVGALLGLKEVRDGMRDFDYNTLRFQLHAAICDYVDTQLSLDSRAGRGLLVRQTMLANMDQRIDEAERTEREGPVETQGIPRSVIEAQWPQSGDGPTETPSS